MSLQFLELDYSEDPGGGGGRFDLLPTVTDYFIAFAIAAQVDDLLPHGKKSYDTV